RSAQQRSTIDSFRSTRERGPQASSEPSRSTQQRSSIDSFRSTRQSASRNEDRVKSTNSRPAWSHPEARSSFEPRRAEAPRQSRNERTALRGSQERPRTIAA